MLSIVSNRSVKRSTSIINCCLYANVLSESSSESNNTSEVLFCYILNIVNVVKLSDLRSHFVVHENVNECTATGCDNYCYTYEEMPVLTNILRNICTMDLYSK